MLKVIATLMALGFLPMAISTAVEPELHRPPRILKHQGRLLDATDKPVNGTHDLTVRLYNVPSGGSPLSTSTSSVVFEDGLFLIGLSDDAINMMFASIAGGDNRYLGFEVDIDGEMSPRQLITSAPYSILSSGVGSSQPIGGSFDTAKIDFQTTGTGATLRISTKEPTKLEIPNLRMTGDVSGADFSMTGDPDFDLLRMSADADSAKIRISGQSIGDPDFDLLRISGGGGGSGGSAITMTGDPDFDLLRFSADADSAEITMSGQIIGDPDFDLMSMKSTPKLCETTVKSKNSVGNIRGVTTVVDSATASFHQWTWASGSVKRNMISMISDDETGTMTISNAAGTRGLVSRVNNSGGSIAIDEEGVQKIAMSTDGDSAGIAIGEQGVQITMYADTGRRALVVVTDDDTQKRIVLKTDSTHSEIAINEEGVQITMRADSGGGGGIAIDEEGVQKIAMSTDGSSSSIAVNEDGTHNITISVDSGGLANIGINETLAGTKVSFNSDGVGYVDKRFGIGDTSPTNPLGLASGAHCTVGGVFTNASDRNSKENFEEVDGESLLEKIESLDINEWNYKIESEDIKHIGPTAQDFYKAFGVGGDDKTISTVDPSGIALAAIKELYKKSKEVDELKKQLDELTKVVEKLAKERK